MSGDFKSVVLRLLREDEEFRYAVAGLIGLEEVLKRLDRVEEGQNRLWEEVRALREEQTKIWQEIRGLREEQTKLREEQTKIWQEIHDLREEQAKIWQEIKGLREEQTKIWSEIRDLREEQAKIWEEIRGLREEQIKLREEQTKIWSEIRSLREGQNELWKSFRSFLADFRELGRAVGMTLDHYTAAFLRRYLEERGYPPDRIDIAVNSKLMVNDRFIEVDIFNLNPLIIGEVTTYIRSREEAEREIKKLLEKRRLIETAYGRRAEMVILAVANVEESAMQILREDAEREGVTVFIGKATEAMHPM